MNAAHPERQDDEIYLGNYDQESAATCGWRTKRLGEVALDASGKPLGEDWPGNLPLFVKKAEIVEAGVAYLFDLEAGVPLPAREMGR